jgi:hypothetical protein
LKNSSVKSGTGQGIFSMNEQEFKEHLKDLVHGHHHREEHDWENSQRRSASDESKTTRTPAKTAGTRSRSSRPTDPHTVADVMPATLKVWTIRTGAAPGFDKNN